VDALTHAIEAYVSRLANESTDPYALSAIKLIWNSIRPACRDGSNEEARKNMMVGSFQAGIAFSNASVALVHGMSEPLGACFHVPHGLSNAMLLPAATKFSIAAAPVRYAHIARVMGLAQPGQPDDQCCRILVEQLFQLNRDLKLQTPASFGIDKKEYDSMIEKMAADTLASGCTAHNPIVPTLEQTMQIYQEIYE
jgi:alcohol dehydrogenase class IV